MTPLQINILLACYCSPRPRANFSGATWESPAATEAREQFRANGLMNEHSTALTTAGNAIVAALCAVPMVPAVDPLQAERDALTAKLAGLKTRHESTAPTEARLKQATTDALNAGRG